VKPARSPAPDFALIGHQESWNQIARIVHHLRSPDKPLLELDTIRETVPWIPPRAIVRARNTSILNGPVHGVYVETFLTPDDLAAGSGLRRGIQKIEEAIAVAAREGARIAALGGFTSILLEGRARRLPGPPGMALTTGNSLTAGFIVQGIERASAMVGIPLAEASLLVIGATGDVGSACARYFAGRVGRLLLVARRRDRLDAFAQVLDTSGIEIRCATDTAALLSQADLVIAAASLGQASIDLAGCRPGAVVCDAGYPKNLRPPAGGEPRIFFGGMGRALGGWNTDSPLLDSFYSFPLPCIGHGCLLEGIVLAMERRFEPFSYGRGNITPSRIDEMLAMAERHGVVLSPFFDHRGLWTEQPPAVATGRAVTAFPDEAPSR
jgi:fatty aldehyde-generating acyl-ACP reductase